MPAPAVIPAPLAYIKVVAVKKLVVEPLSGLVLALVRLVLGIRLQDLEGIQLFTRRSRHFTLKKLECLRQAIARIY